ncbi:dienelactone hydrolase family protein [uncultured Amnibacterium sp.]|uniref:dienelactone hydrolase family protein n=1 Tax=uncultured Amnibacterium sp. TaxID=1631851 RepID=UPI0035CA49D5
MPTLTDLQLLTLPGGSPGLTGVLGLPDGEGPWPGVVMVHEAFGLTPVMRRQVERMASAGFAVLMPDLFVQGGPRKCLRSTFRDIARGEGRAFTDVESARRALVNRDDCTGRVGVLGFCMGGGFALMAVKNHGFSAASANYGRLPKQLDEQLTGACPVVGSYGGRDLSLRGAAAKLDAALVRAGVPHDVKEYPTAGHAFLDDEAPSVNPVLDLVLQQVLHATPDPEASADAWRRIDGFFTEHLALELDD